LLKPRRKHGPIGLDLGASCLKMLQFAEEGGQPIVVAAAHQQLPASLADPDQRSAAVQAFVNDALRRHPFRGREVVSSLGISSFQLKSIRLPPMPAEEIAGAVEFEAKDRFDLGGRAAQVRHITAGEVRHGNETKQEILVFAALEDEVQARLRLLESCGLRPVAVDITPCAVARGFVRYLRRAEDAAAVNVFLDVGWRGTSIIITRGAEMAFLKVVEVGGEHFTDAVAKTLDISKDEAADLRLRIMHGTGGRRASDAVPVAPDVATAVSDTVRPLVERLSRDLQLCLRYFAVTFRGQRPDSLTFVGGQAHEPSLAGIIAATVDIPCTIGHPLRGVGRLGLIGGYDRRTFQPAWTVVCGLALRGFDWTPAAAQPRTQSTARSTAATVANKGGESA
jgi:type IV pilus assembly protein PilM